MNGITSITKTFERTRAEKRAALMPYFTLGYPTAHNTVAVIQALAENGADLIELGVPFSDPLADGPTIQRSTQIALEQGMTVAGCMDMVRKIRASGVKQPLILMGYINPVLAYGARAYVADACAAGASGLIIPDLPLEEAGFMEALCREAGLALIYLATPGSSEQRLNELAQHSSGFLYLVSLNGVTGAREALPVGLSDFIERARKVSAIPLAVGFGIATPDQAALVGHAADGVIIGSALIDAAGKATDPAAAAGQYIRGIRSALVSG